MQLSDRAVAWLRALEPGSVPDRDEATATLVALALMAARTPAWREPYRRALHGLGDAQGSALVTGVVDRVHGTDTPVPADLAALRAATAGAAATWDLVEHLGGDAAWARFAAAPSPACPVIVGVEFPEVVLRRAEWDRDCLWLGVDPAHPDPAARTEFRLVGGEPRMWYLTGIDDVMTDVSSHGMTMRFPRVAGEIVLTPGSY